MLSVSFFTVFIRWVIVSCGHSVFWWHKSRGSESWVAGNILHVMTSISCYYGVCLVAHSKGVWQNLQGWLSAVSRHLHVAVAVQIIGGKSHLPGDGCDEHVELVVFCAGEGFAKQCRWDPIGLTGEHLICLLAGIFDCSTVKSLITAPV